MSPDNQNIFASLRTSFDLLSKRERIKFIFTSVAQIGLSMLDLLGVILIGAIAALAINGIAGRGAGNRVSYVLGLLGLDGINLQSQTLILGAISSTLLISKTIIGYFITKKTSHFLSRRSALISNTLFEKLISRDLIYLRSRSTQQYLFSLTTSVQALVNGILITVSTVIGDLVLTITLIAGMSILDWKMSLFTIFFYGLLALILNQKIRNKYINLGKAQSELIVSSNALFLDSLNSYRDLKVRNAQQQVISKFSEKRIKLASYAAEFALSNNISKYSMEVALVFGAILVCGYEFATQDASRAIATLAVFLASSARIAPAIMRIQQGFITIRSTIASTEVLTEIIREFSDEPNFILESERFRFSGEKFVPNVELRNVHFQYPNNSSFQIEKFDLFINSGVFCALVGPSGGGKSTIVDLMLGVIKPTKGEVYISGASPENIYNSHKGKVSYVPQEVHLIDGTIEENICFYDSSDVNQIQLAIKNSQLETLIQELPNGSKTKIGERGTKLSGGQRQRLGIARALYTQPELLILDEATSALDGNTESEISKTIHSLKGKKTVIVIAHRLSTVKDADSIIYIDKGRIIAQGTFEEVRKLVPDFDKQAKLMNL